MCLLHADLDPAHERDAGRGAAGPGVIDVCALARGVPGDSASTSGWSRPSPTPRCGPVCRPYLTGLAVVRRRGAGDDLGRRAGAVARRGRAPGAPAVVGSGGRACALPRRSRWRAGRRTRSAFDMGGTSTDVCLVREGARPASRPRRVAGLPGAAAVGGHAHHRRRWRLDRPARPGRRARRGPGRERGRASRPGLLRAGRRARDGDRRRPRARAASRPTPRSPGIGTTLDVGAARACARPRRASTAEGVVAVVERGDGAARAAGDGEQRGRPSRARAGRVRRRRSAARVRGRRRRWACATVIVPRRGRRVLRGRAADLTAPPGGGAQLAVGRGTRRAGRRARRRWPPRPAPRWSSGRGSVDDRWLDCRYAGQSHEHPGGSGRRVRRREHERRNGYRRGRPGRGRRVCGRWPRRRRRCALAELPAGWAGRWPDRWWARRSSRRGTARMWVPDGWRPGPGRSGARGSCGRRR